MNPVAIREIRQLVRSKTVATGLILYLFAQLAAVVLTVFISAKSDAALLLLCGAGMGQIVSGVVCLVHSALSCAAIPLFAGIRMTLEKDDGNTGLQFVTALRPTQFVDGKTASATVLLLLFSAATLPFLMLAYILRGVDVLSTLLGVCSTLLTALCLTHAAIWIGSSNHNAAFRIVLMLLALFIAVPTLLSAGMAAFVFANFSNPGGMHPTPSLVPSFGVAALAVAVAATFSLILRAATAAQLSPSFANSQRPMRATIAISCFVWGLVAIVVSAVKDEASIMMAWVFPTTVILHFVLFGAVSSRPGYSRRVLSEINPRHRIRGFLLSSGAENGVMFVLVLILLTMFGGCAAVSSSDHAMSGLTVYILYPCACLILMRAWWQARFHRMIHHKYVGWLGFLLMFAGLFITSLVAIGGGASIIGLSLLTVVFFLFSVALYMPHVARAADQFHPPQTP